jgi:hypothetical protein
MEREGTNQKKKYLNINEKIPNVIRKSQSATKGLKNMFSPFSPELQNPQNPHVEFWGALRPSYLFRGS